MSMRIGIGYDIHPLRSNRKLILGGIEVPHHKGLAGHSDADALIHAVCDAILGALGEVNILSSGPCAPTHDILRHDSTRLTRSAVITHGCPGKA